MGRLEDLEQRVEEMDRSARETDRRVDRLENRIKFAHTRLDALAGRLLPLERVLRERVEKLEASEGETVKKRGELEDCVLRQMDKVTDLKVKVDLLEKLMGGLETSVDIHRKRLGDLEWGDGEHARARRELEKAAERVKATEPLPWPVAGTLLARLGHARRYAQVVDKDPDRAMVEALLDWMGGNRTLSREFLERELEG